MGSASPPRAPKGRQRTTARRQTTQVATDGCPGTRKWAERGSALQGIRCHGLPPAAPAAHSGGTAPGRAGSAAHCRVRPANSTAGCNSRISPNPAHGRRLAAAHARRRRPARYASSLRQRPGSSPAPATARPAARAWPTDQASCSSGYLANMARALSLTGKHDQRRHASAKAVRPELGQKVAASRLAGAPMPGDPLFK